MSEEAPESEPDPLEHQPVMLEAVIDALAIRAGGVYLDGTFGRGGHAKAVLARLGEEGRLLVMDKDPVAIDAARRLAVEDRRVTVERGSFAMLERLVDSLGLRGRVDGVFFDLGVSSPQLDDPRRGFSFREDGPLDMRMDNQSGPSAAQWLGEATVEDITRVLFDYGEERNARRIARAIERERAEHPITTTGQLAAIVEGASRVRDRHKHPATRTFQAIRIHINRELDDLRAGLEQALNVLAKGGRLVVISFHSLEDRIVKRFIREQERGPKVPREVILARPFQPRLKAMGKAHKATEAEIEANVRARSAVLRVAQKIE